MRWVVLYDIVAHDGYSNHKKEVITAPTLARATDKAINSVIAPWLVSRATCKAVLTAIIRGDVYETMVSDRVDGGGTRDDVRHDGETGRSPEQSNK